MPLNPATAVECIAVLESIVSLEKAIKKPQPKHRSEAGGHLHLTHICNPDPELIRRYLYHTNGKLSERRWDDIRRY